MPVGSGAPAGPACGAGSSPGVGRNGRSRSYTSCTSTGRASGALRSGCSTSSSSASGTSARSSRSGVGAALMCCIISCHSLSPPNSVRPQSSSQNFALSRGSVFRAGARASNRDGW